MKVGKACAAVVVAALGLMVSGCAKSVPAGSYKDLLNTSEYVLHGNGTYTSYQKVNCSISSGRYKLEDRTIQFIPDSKGTPGAEGLEAIFLSLLTAEFSEDRQAFSMHGVPYVYVGASSSHPTDACGQVSALGSVPEMTAPDGRTLPDATRDMPSMQPGGDTLDTSFESTLPPPRSAPPAGYPPPLDPNQFEKKGSSPPRTISIPDR